MRRRPPRATRTDTLCPYTTLFRSGRLRRSSLCDGAVAPEPRVCRLVLVLRRRATEEVARVIALWTSVQVAAPAPIRSEEHTSELQSLMRTSYAVFCLKKKTAKTTTYTTTIET